MVKWDGQDPKAGALSSHSGEAQCKGEYTSPQVLPPHLALSPGAFSSSSFSLVLLLSLLPPSSLS